MARWPCCIMEFARGHWSPDQIMTGVVAINGVHQSTKIRGKRGKNVRAICAMCGAEMYAARLAQETNSISVEFVIFPIIICAAVLVAFLCVARAQQCRTHGNKDAPHTILINFYQYCISSHGDCVRNERSEYSCRMTVCVCVCSNKYIILMKSYTQRNSTEVYNFSLNRSCSLPPLRPRVLPRFPIRSGSLRPVRVAYSAFAPACLFV